LNIFVPGGTVPRALRLPLSVVLLACVSDWACGADTPFAAPSAQGAISPTGGTLRVTVAMILVLGAVLAAAWLARRLRGMSGAPSSALEVLAQVSLGTRERAVLIRVGERQVLIGVAPGSVRMLHLVEASASGSAASGSSASGSSALSVADGPPRPSFKALLLKSLGK
jgi:flagellar protein FliO/FliZ